jgi:hypothetical protein
MQNVKIGRLGKVGVLSYKVFFLSPSENPRVGSSRLSIIFYMYYLIYSNTN